MINMSYDAHRCVKYDYDYRFHKKIIKNTYIFSWEELMSNREENGNLPMISLIDKVPDAAKVSD